MKIFLAFCMKPKNFNFTEIIFVKFMKYLEISQILLKENQFTLNTLIKFIVNVTIQILEKHKV